MEIINTRTVKVSTSDELKDALADDKGNCVELTEESKLNRNSVTTECKIDEYAETGAAYIE